MEKTFKLYQVKGDILTYKDGKKTVRQYDNRMTEDFAIAYLTKGTDKQIEERKKLFKVLPKSLKKQESEKEQAPQTEEKQEATKSKSRKSKKVDNE